MDIKYTANASFKTADETNMILTTEIYSFSVIGGANRSIDLSSTNDMSISSEMEQARSYKNIILYKLPSKDFADFALMEAFRTKQLFNLYLIISIYVGKNNTQSLWLTAKNATISEHPMKTGDQLTLLKATISIPKCRIEYTQCKNEKDCTSEDW